MPKYIIDQVIPQDKFEKILELLVTYKKMNPKEDIYLSEKSIKKVFNWYQGVSESNSLLDPNVEP